MKSTLALSSAALLAVAQAQGVITLGDGSKDISKQDWISVGKDANLTDSQTFTGRSVSKKYPGNAQGGWSVSLAIQDNLSAKGSDDLLTAATVTMSAGGDDSTIDDSWRVCAHVFPVMSSAATAWGAEFDPDCNGIVAAECIDDLMKRGRSKFGPGCPSWKITASCLRDLNEQTGYSVVMNEDLISGEEPFYRSIDGSHPASDDSNTVYLASAESPLAIVTVFGASGDSEDDPYAQVRCVLADTVEGDSFDPTPEDAAPGLTKFAGWAVLTCAVAFQFLF